MEDLPHEINKIIFEYLTIKNIIKLCLLNKAIKKFVNETIWDHDILNINYDIVHKNNKIINYLVNSFNIKKYNLSYCTNITDESVKMLANCHTLDLSCCTNITDKSVKMLANCHILDVSYCNKITDESVKMLANCARKSMQLCCILFRSCEKYESMQSIDSYLQLIHLILVGVPT